MKIDWTVKVNDYKGRKCLLGSEHASLGDLVCFAIEQPMPGDERLSFTDKLARNDLLIRIKDGEAVGDADLAIVKERLALVFAPHFVGAANKLLVEIPKEKEADAAAKS
jgi:hypothetical protein